MNLEEKNVNGFEAIIEVIRFDDKEEDIIITSEGTAPLPCDDFGDAE